MCIYTSIARAIGMTLPRIFRYLSIFLFSVRWNILIKNVSFLNIYHRILLFEAILIRKFVLQTPLVTCVKQIDELQWNQFVFHFWLYFRFHICISYKMYRYCLFSSNLYYISLYATESIYYNNNTRIFARSSNDYFVCRTYTKNSFESSKYALAIGKM